MPAAAIGEPWIRAHRAGSGRKIGESRGTIAVVRYGLLSSSCRPEAVAREHQLSSTLTKRFHVRSAQPTATVRICVGGIAANPGQFD